MKIAKGNITKAKADAIVNAANGMGPMGGGVALALRRAGGRIIEDEAIEVCRKQDPQVGEVYVTTAGALSARYIFHAVTMKRPAERSTAAIVEQCLKSLIAKAREMNVKSLVIPALATGVGGVSKSEAARVFAQVLSCVSDIDITVMDINDEFIEALKTYTV